MSSQSVFSPRLLIGWIAAAALTFACSLYFMGGGGDDGKKPGSGDVGPGTFSHSAIGHAGIAETLQRLGIPAVKSQYDSLGKLGDGSVLVIAEPLFSLEILKGLPALLKAKTVLLVLPKWQGKQSKTRADWLGSVDLLPTGPVEVTLDFAVKKGEIIRKSAVERWDRNTLGHTPTIVSPVQLMRSDRLRPIVATADGILVGELGDQKQRLWVLADPDILANHGLGKGDNAAFAVALINALRGADGRVVFDETTHGYVARPASPLMLLFKFPFVVATLQGAIAIALLLWATIARFGAPESAPPALGAGKQGLIQNAAKLLEFAGYQHVIVRRYVHATLRDVARQFHAPRGLSDSALLGWLERVGQVRAVEVDCVAIYRRADDVVRDRHVPLIPIARDIHRWKREILDGPPGHTRNH